MPDVQFYPEQSGGGMFLFVEGNAQITIDDIDLLDVLVEKLVYDLQRRNVGSDHPSRTFAMNALVLARDVWFGSLEEPDEFLARLEAMKGCIRE